MTSHHYRIPNYRARSIKLQPRSTATGDYLVLEFHPDPIITSTLSKLSVLDYSEKLEGYYMKRDEELIRELINHCRGKIWIDQTLVRRKPPDDREVTVKKIRETKSNENHTMDPETMSKIEAMDRWMTQKRYSRNTIKTYLSFIKQFFGKTGIRWDQMAVPIIDKYNYQHFIKGKKSHSTQNQ